MLRNCSSPRIKCYLSRVTRLRVHSWREHLWVDQNYPILREEDKLSEKPFSSQEDEALNRSIFIAEPKT